MPKSGSSPAGFRLTSLFSEVGRNLLSGTTRLLAVCVTLAAITGGAIAADDVAVSRLVSAAESFRDSGAGTYVLTAPGQVSGAACERLNSLPGVSAAGAVRGTDQELTVTRLPSAPLSGYQVTPGLLTALTGSPGQSDGLWLSARAATTIGVTRGDELVTAAGGVRVTGVFEYPDDGRRPGLGYAAVFPATAEGRYDECWMAVWPPDTDTRSMLWGALSALPLDATDQGGQDARIVQLNTAFGQQYTVVDEYLNRPTRFLAPAAAVVAAILGLTCVRLRRVELAAARQLGLSAVTQAAQVLVESAVAAVIAAALVAATAMVTDRFAAAEVGQTVAVVSGSVILGALLGCATVRPGRLFAYLRER